MTTSGVGGAAPPPPVSAQIEIAATKRVQSEERREGEAAVRMIEEARAVGQAGAPAKGRLVDTVA